MDRVGYEVICVFCCGIFECRDVQVYAAALTAQICSAVAGSSYCARDHRIDVIDITAVIICDEPAQLCFQICVYLIQ